MSTTAELCSAAAGRAARALRRLGGLAPDVSVPHHGAQLDPESRVLAAARAVLPPTEVNPRGAAQDREGQRGGLGVGASTEAGQTG